MQAETVRAEKLRNRLETALLEQLDYTQVNGNKDKRLPGLSNISFAYVEGEGLMMAIPDIAVSSGSACTSASLEPSYVLKALGLLNISYEHREEDDLGGISLPKG